MIYDLYDSENRIELPDLRITFPQIFEAYFAEKIVLPEETNFEYINGNSVNKESYIVVETRHFRERPIYIVIRDKNGNQLDNKGNWMDPFQLKKEQITVEGTIGDFYEEALGANKEEYLDRAIIPLKSLFLKANNWEQNAGIQITVDGHSPNTDYQKEAIVYHENTMLCP